MNQSPLVPATPSRSGFTLIELMISIAISLLLVAGINAIFRTTAETIGSGQATLQTTRDLRNAFDTLDSDFGGMLDSGSQPLLMIYNQNQPGFRDKLDEKTDAQFSLANEASANNSAVYGSRDGISPNSTPPFYPGGAMPLIADNRNQRVDIISFFSSGHFRRQTGLQDELPTVATYQSDYKSDTAYIWYGHLDLPDKDPAFWQKPNTFLPHGMTSLSGVPQSSLTNPNGFYGNQKILGRMAILLGSPEPLGIGVNPPKYLPASAPHQAYLNSNIIPPTANPTVAQILQPFSFNSAATYDGLTNIGGATPFYPIQESRCDLAGISVDSYLQKVKAVSLTSNLPIVRNSTWYYPLLSRVLPNASPKPAPQDTFRFAGKPWATRNYAGSVPPAPPVPLNTVDRRDDMALSAPVFMKGCSQFIVEFAGDYTTQVDAPAAANHAQITAEASDQILDFDSVPMPTGPRQKRIRWYGLPRSYGDSANADVRPVYDFMKDPKVNISAIAATAVALPFEKLGYAAGPANLDAFPLNRPNEVRSYVCAWNPYDLQFPLPADPLSASKFPAPGSPKTMGDAYPNGLMPWMIRLTIRVDDPNGRLPEGQTVQYIFNLPHK